MLQFVDILYITLLFILLFELISNLYKFPLTLVTVTSVCPFNTFGIPVDFKYIDFVAVSVKLPILLVIDVEVISSVSSLNIFSLTQLS